MAGARSRAEPLEGSRVAESCRQRAALRATCCRVGAVVALALAAGCHRQPSTILEEAPDAVLERLGREGHRVDVALGDGAVRYLGYEAFPEGAFPGDQVTLVHYWTATRALEADYRVFVHFLVQGARGHVPHGDHDPIPPTRGWPVGAVIRDEHRVELPGRLLGRRVDPRVGLYAGDRRMPVRIDDLAAGDGDDRIRAPGFAVNGTPVPLPVYEAARLSAPITADGTAGAGEWAGTTEIERFVASDGSRPARRSTRARLGWDAEHLYLAFEADDPDILGTYTRRDEPVYREESLEIFIDPTGTGDDYVELQVSPKGTQFDASFRGGPRRGMRTSWDARYQSAVVVDGTVEPLRGTPAGADRGWRSEWIIEAASIPGLETPLSAGRELRINLFRIGKDRTPSGELVPDESAWSPPLMGDFHNPERFGILRLR